MKKRFTGFSVVAAVILLFISSSAFIQQLGNTHLFPLFTFRYFLFTSQGFHVFQANTMASQNVDKHAELHQSDVLDGREQARVHESKFKPRRVGQWDQGGDLESFLLHFRSNRTLYFIVWARAPLRIPRRSTASNHESPDEQNRDSNETSNDKFP